VKIIWEKPLKICGNLKGYYVQDAGKFQLTNSSNLCMQMKIIIRC